MDKICETHQVSYIGNLRYNRYKLKRLGTTKLWKPAIIVHFIHLVSLKIVPQVLETNCVNRNMNSW